MEDDLHQHLRLSTRSGSDDTIDEERNTKGSSNEHEEEESKTSNSVAFGKENLPPLYVDI